MMSRFGAKKGRKLPGAEFTWETDAGGEPDTAPTPLYPVRFLGITHCDNGLKLTITSTEI